MTGLELVLIIIATPLLLSIGSVLPEIFALLLLGITGLICCIKDFIVNLFKSKK